MRSIGLSACEAILPQAAGLPYAPRRVGQTGMVDK
jgi:hypothetical protein